MSQGNGARALDTARSRVVMAKLIGWKALEKSWQADVDHLLAHGGEERQAKSYQKVAKTARVNVLAAIETRRKR